MTDPETKVSRNDKVAREPALKPKEYKAVNPQTQITKVGRAEVDFFLFSL